MPRPYLEVEPGSSPLKTRGASITNPEVITRENPLARPLWHWDSGLKFIYPVSRFPSGKSLVLAVPNIMVLLFILKPAVQSLNMKRLITILAAITVATFVSAQTSSVTGSTNTVALNGSITESWTGGGWGAINFDGLDAELLPSKYTGDYNLSVSVTADGSWDGDSVPKLTSFYMLGSTGASNPLGELTFSVGNTTSYNPVTFKASDISGLYSGSLVGFNYANIILEPGEHLNISASYTLTAVPEPSTYALFLGVGTLGLVGWRRFRRK